MQKLSGVPETMLLTLYHRAIDTQRQDRLIEDRFAVTMVDRIDYDFSRFNDWKMQWGIPVRTRLIDRAVEEFLERYPDSLIVTLGAGLCTRALRMDNERAQWLSIDLEDVRPFWEELIGTSARNHFITRSVTDFSWIDLVKERQQDRAVLFIAEGLFQYLPEPDVKQVIAKIQQHFPNSEIVMEVLGEFMVNNTKLTRSVAKTGAVFQWGVNDCQELESWSPGITMLDQWYFFDYGRDRQRYLKILPYLVGGKGQFGKVARFRLT